MFERIGCKGMDQWTIYRAVETPYPQWMVGRQIWTWRDRGVLLSDKEGGRQNLPDGWLQPDQREAARLQGRVHLPRLRGTGDLLHPGIDAQLVSNITQTIKQASRRASKTRSATKRWSVLEEQRRNAAELEGWTTRPPWPSTQTTLPGAPELRCHTQWTVRAFWRRINSCFERQSPTLRAFLVSGDNQYRS